MPLSMRAVIFSIGVFLFIIIFHLVRKKKFREELSLIWLLIGPIFILSSFADYVIDPIASRLGVSYPPALIFLAVLFSLIFALLYFSIVVSDLKSRNKELSQKMALLEYRVSQISREDLFTPQK